MRATMICLAAFLVGLILGVVIGSVAAFMAGTS